MVGQRTLKNTIRATGVGLHTGKKVLMTLRPAPPDTGIVFRRTDLPQAAEVRGARRERRRHDARHHALPGQHAGLHRGAPAVGVRRARASTTPSWSCRRRKCRSWTAAPGRFVFLLQSAGIEEQREPKHFIRIKKRLRGGGRRQVGGVRARSTASRSTSRSSSITRSSSGGRRRASMDFSTTSFLKEVSRARTFGFMRDLEIAARAQSRARRQPGQRHRAG